MEWGAGIDGEDNLCAGAAYQFFYKAPMEDKRLVYVAAAVDVKYGFFRRGLAAQEIDVHSVNVLFFDGAAELYFWELVHLFAFEALVLERIQRDLPRAVVSLFKAQF